MKTNNPMRSMICVSHRSAPSAGKTWWSRNYTELIEHPKVEHEAASHVFVVDPEKVVRFLCEACGIHFVEQFFQQNVKADPDLTGGRALTSRLKFELAWRFRLSAGQVLVSSALFACSIVVSRSIGN